jgi:hypothetical protein
MTALGCPCHGNSAGFATRIPTQAEKKFFSQGIYVISPEELGKVVKVLDEKCPTCIRKVRYGAVPFGV